MRAIVPIRCEDFLPSRGNNTKIRISCRSAFRFFPTDACFLKNASKLVFLSVFFDIESAPFWILASFDETPVGYYRKHNFYFGITKINTTAPTDKRGVKFPIEPARRSFMSFFDFGKAFVIEITFRCLVIYLMFFGKAHIDAFIGFHEPQIVTWQFDISFREFQSSRSIFMVNKDFVAFLIVTDLLPTSSGEKFCVLIHTACGTS